MSAGTYLFTSESVSEGHPDKVCDRISDTIVDEFMGAEPESRVAVETLTTTNQVVLAGVPLKERRKGSKIHHKSAGTFLLREKSNLPTTRVVDPERLPGTCECL